MALREYLQILRRRWQLIVVCVLIAMAGAVLFTLQANAILLVHVQAVHLHAN